MAGKGAFPTTRWTLVVAAGGKDGEASRDALESLCSGYWYPLYAYVRRRGYSPEQAQDLTQEFFFRLLSRRTFEIADRQKGHFRSFLLTSLKFFLSDDSDRSHAQKRGGGVATLPFEISTGEEVYLRDPGHTETPDRIFERRWARALLDRVVNRLRDESVREGRLDHFNRLKVFLLGQTDVPYVELAQQMGTSEGALKVGIHRLRKRYKELLRAEISETVADPAEIDGELRYLAAVLSTK